MAFYLKIWLTKKTSEQKGVHNRWVKEKTVRFRYNPQSLENYLQIKRLNKPNENIQCTYKRHISNIRTEKSWKKKNGKELYCAYSKQKSSQSYQIRQKRLQRKKYHQR